MFSETDKKVLQVVLVVGLFSVVGLFYYVWAVVADDVKRRDVKIGTAKEQIEEREEHLNDLKDWENRTDEILGLVEALEKEMKRLPTRIDEREFFDILGECVAMANLSDITVSRPVARGKAAGKRDMGAYTERPYTIKCKARYHDLGQFLTLLEQHPKQIMRLKTLDVRNDPKRPSRHPVTIQVATFVFNQPRR